ncbi:MAG TPA: NAD(P)-binding protein [Clostridia bacterium]|nr:NAD(P)-binding protein [Clostridia bacterium]
MNNNWDVIVVGAGLGGLTAAATAAYKGKKVLLLEKNNTLGGVMTSFVRGRFEFEASLQAFYGFGIRENAGSARKILDELKISSAVNWAPVPAAYRVITKARDGDSINADMPFGIENYIEKMEEYVPGSRPSMERLFALADDIDDTLEFMRTVKVYDFKTILAVLKKHLNFFRTAPYSVDDVLNALGVPPKAQDIFNACWQFIGAPTDSLSFIHYITIIRSYLIFGAVVPRFRSFELSMAIASSIERHGGHIWYNSKVDRLLVKNGKAYGVRLSDKIEVYAKNIICGISPSTVFSKMINHNDVPERDLQLTSAKSFGARGFSVYLALNRSPETLGITDYSVILHDTADTREQFSLMKSFDTNNTVTAICLNAAVPSSSPKGTTLICLSSLYTSDCFSEVRQEDYYNLKYSLAKKMIERYEHELNVNLHDYIEEIEIATPMTFARYTGSPQGTIKGYLCEQWDGIVPRAMMRKDDLSPLGIRFCGGFGEKFSGMCPSIQTGYDAVCDLITEEKEKAAKEEALNE